MNRNSYIVYDLETGSRNPHTTQITQIAALAIDRNLQVLGTFNSEVCPVFDPEQCKKLKLGIIEDEALTITRKTREQLEKAPQLKIVWESFVAFVAKYNIGNSAFDKPIPVGYNINNFDSIIINRMCAKFGPFDRDEQKPKLFHAINSCDVMTYIFHFTENNPSVRSLSLDNTREMLGMSKEHGHDALCDVVDTAEIMIRFMRLYRNISSKTKFEGSCSSRLLDLNNIKKL